MHIVLVLVTFNAFLNSIGKVMYHMNILDGFLLHIEPQLGFMAGNFKA